jgi:hypothetical protein
MKQIYSIIGDHHLQIQVYTLEYKGSVERKGRSAEMCIIYLYSICYPLRPRTQGCTMKYIFLFVHT